MLKNGQKEYSTKSLKGTPAIASKELPFNSNENERNKRKALRGDENALDCCSGVSSRTDSPVREIRDAEIGRLHPATFNRNRNHTKETSL